MTPLTEAAPATGSGGVVSAANASASSSLLGHVGGGVASAGAVVSGDSGCCNGDSVWAGASVGLASGVSVGDGSVGAGALVAVGGAVVGVGVGSSPPQATSKTAITSRSANCLQCGNSLL